MDYSKSIIIYIFKDNDIKKVIILNFIISDNVKNNPNRKQKEGIILNKSNEIIEIWEKLYFKVNNKKAPTVIYEQGWFTITNVEYVEFLGVWRSVNLNQFEKIITALKLRCATENR